MSRTASDTFSPLIMLDLKKRARVFWVLSVISVVLILPNRKVSAELKAIVFMAAVLLLSLFLVKHPYNHYFMAPIALLSIVAGCFLKLAFDRLKIISLHRLLLIILVIYIPARHLSKKMYITNNNQTQLDKVKFVLANSQDEDFVYDGHNQFNLYRRDLHYFWYSLAESGGLDIYNRLTDNKYGDYDISSLIKTKQPKIISNYRLDIFECGLDHVYKQTRYSDLYIKEEERQPVQNN